MDVLFKASFQRDLRKIKDKKLLNNVREAIDAVKPVDDSTRVRRLKNMTGYNSLLPPFINGTKGSKAGLS